MEKIVILLTSDEKKEFAEISKELGFSQSQLALFIIYSLVGMYKKRGSFLVVELEQPRYVVSNSRNKRVQVVCPEELKKELEKINRELGYSIAQLCLMAIQSFIDSYKKSGISMVSEILSPEYRV